MKVGKCAFKGLVIIFLLCQTHLYRKDSSNSTEIHTTNTEIEAGTSNEVEEIVEVQFEKTADKETDDAGVQ